MGMIIDFLIKKTIKNYENKQDQTVRAAYGNMAAIVGIVTNFFLALFKLALGIVVGSISMIADGINNLSDGSSSFITLIGFRIAKKPRDSHHPYGHARSEYISGMIVSILIVVVGIELLRSSILKIFNPHTTNFSWIAVLILVLSIAVKLWQSHFYNVIGNRINSIALNANSTDSRNDVISTMVVIINMVFFKYTGLDLDGYAGCLVAIFIIKSGFDLVKDTASPLIGESPNSNLVKFIKKKACSYDGVLGVHDLVVHDYGGNNIFASIHFEIDSKTNVMDSHDLIDRIERDFLTNHHIQITGHLDPINNSDPRIAEVTDILMAVVNEIDGIREPHDIRLVSSPTHINVIFDVVVEDSKLNSKEITDKINAALRQLDRRYSAILSFDEDYTQGL